MTQDPSGQRLFDRVEASLSVEVRWDGGAATGHLLDLSPTGAFMQCAPQPPQGTPCEVRILGGDAGTLEATARAVRVVEAGVGVEFVEMSLEAIGVLHRLLQP